MMPTPTENFLPRRRSPAISTYNENEIVLIRGYGLKNFPLVSVYDTTKDSWRLIFENDPILFSNDLGFDS